MSEPTKPAYLVACGTMLSGEPDPEYAKRATAPALKAGLTPIAGGEVGTNVEVLEGELPAGTRFMAIEQFDSEALQTFWHSEEYQSAIPFRKDSVKMHFIAALKGIAPEEIAEQLEKARANK